MRTAMAVAAVLAFGFVHAAAARTPVRESPAVEQKMLGAWDGGGGCNGKLALRADGTYALTRYGPGAATFEGTWAVRRVAGSPTLVLTCLASKIEGAVGTSKEWKLVTLDADRLVVELVPGGAPTTYTRVRE